MLTFAAEADPLTPLLQYGAVGAIAVMLALAVRVLFNRETQRADQETARADRLESELSKLNETVRTECVGTLVKATEAIADALAAARRN